MSAVWDEPPCGLLRLDDAGRVLACNREFRRLCGFASPADAPARVDGLLRPGSLLYFQTALFPSLQLSGRVDEVYLELASADGGSVPVLVNARRDAAAGTSDWAVMRIEQRGRWEEAVAEARRVAEHESRENARKSEELAQAKSDLEHVLEELKDSNWMLRKVADVLPVCMYCGRVRPGQRPDTEWESAADFLKRNSGFLSHGCCPRCIDLLRRQLGLPEEAPPGGKG